MISETEGNDGNVCRNDKNCVKNAESKLKNGSLFEERVHEHRESILSSPNGYRNMSGIQNLAISLMVVFGVKEILESINKYGILIDYTQQFNAFFGNLYYPILVYISAHVLVFLSLTIEKLLSKGQITEKTGQIAIVTVILSELLFSCITTYFTDGSIAAVIVSQTSCFATVCKMVSFHMVNHSYRTKVPTTLAERKEFPSQDNSKAAEDRLQTKLVSYPDNLTFKDAFEFLYFPTFCYEINFPRRPRIRKMFLFKQVVEACFVMEIMLCIIQQWMAPILVNKFNQSKDLRFTELAEISLKLSMPTVFVWISFFHLYFHSGLNIVGEIFRFGDREFYLDWWNQITIPRFWRSWNIPVYQWSVRHLYAPIRKKGYSQNQASVVIFLVSALVHEIWVGVTIKVFGFWNFLGMLAQIPAAIFTTKSFRTHYGNFVVWIFLSLIFPANVLLCYSNYCKKYNC